MKTLVLTLCSAQRPPQQQVRTLLQGCDDIPAAPKLATYVLPSRPMFAPTQAEVRRFFCAVYTKWQNGAPMEAIEQIAAQWMELHPEYHAVLANVDAALEAQYPSDGAGDSRQMGNPFLHLSMHLSISEQCSIDQPRGIRQAVELLAKRKDDLHEAQHAAMDCLGQMLWDAQRNQRAPDGEAYIACVQRKATAF